MVATAHAPFRTTSPGGRLARPAATPPADGGRTRPPLRVVHGGLDPASRRAQARYLRRRAAALVLLLVLVVGVVRLVDAAATGLASPGPADAPSAAGPAAVHVVQPGDTLWSIAERVAPHRDVRHTVDELVELNGSAAIIVGQQLVLPD